MRWNRVTALPSLPNVSSLYKTNISDLNPLMQSMAIYCLTHTNLVAAVDLMANGKQKKNQVKKNCPVMNLLRPENYIIAVSRMC